MNESSEILQALIACDVYSKSDAGQGLLPLESEGRLLLENDTKNAASNVDIGWDAEQCLDFIEMVATLLESSGRSSNGEIVLPSLAVERLGSSLFEAAVKVREGFEANQNGGDA